MYFRPMISAKSPAARAPKKVPQDRMETMREVCEAEMAVAPVPATWSMNPWSARTPLMYPES